jgi:cytochrome c
MVGLWAEADSVTRLRRYDLRREDIACEVDMRLRFWSSAPLVLMAMTQPALAQADAENGKEVFKGCRACHQVGAGAKNGVGPTLNGVIGRKAGTIAGFNYSDANKQAGDKGLVWTEEKMLEYLKDPPAFMPGTKMVFAGVKNEADRRDLVAYLKQSAK